MYIYILVGQCLRKPISLAWVCETFVLWQKERAIMVRHIERKKDRRRKAEMREREKERKMYSIYFDLVIYTWRDGRNERMAWFSLFVESHPVIGKYKVTAWRHSVEYVKKCSAVQQHCLV